MLRNLLIVPYVGRPSPGLLRRSHLIDKRFLFIFVVVAVVEAVNLFDSTESF